MRLRGGKRACLTLLAGLIVIFMLIAYVGLGATWREIERLNPLVFAGILAFSVVGSLIAAARLRTLLRIHGHEVAFPNVYHINVVGVLGNELTPGVHVGGEALRVALLGKQGVGVAPAVTCALLIKIVDALIILSLATLLAFLIASNLLSILALLAATMLVFFLSSFAVALLVGRGYVYRAVRRVLLHVGAREDPARFRLSREATAGLISMSYARWLIFGAQEYLVIRALGVELGFGSVLAIYAASMMVRLAAPLPFGLGVTEAVTAGMYAHFGAALGEAAAAALVTRTYVSLTIAILGAYGGLRMGLDTLRRAIEGNLKSKGEMWMSKEED